MSSLDEKNGRNGTGKLLAVIGDEDTCVGFLLGGIGNVERNEQNFFVVDKTTDVMEIVGAFKRFVKNVNISMILITQDVADMIRSYVDGYVRSQPAVLEIPSKTHPYDASKDSILRRAAGMFTID